MPGFLYCTIVINEVNLLIITLKEHVCPSSTLFLSVAENTASQLIDIAEIRHLKRQVGIGDQRPMGSERFLPVRNLLHFTKDVLEIGIYAPLLSRDLLCESHLL